MLTKPLLYLVAGLLLIVAILGGLYRYELKASAKKDVAIELFEAAQVKTSAAMHRVKAERDLSEKLITEVGTERNTLRSQLNSAKQKIRNLRKGDPDAEKILDSVVPGFVIDELHNYGY